MTVMTDLRYKERMSRLQVFARPSSDYRLTIIGISSEITYILDDERLLDDILVLSPYKSTSE